MITCTSTSGLMQHNHVPHVEACHQSATRKCCVVTNDGHVCHVHQVEEQKRRAEADKLAAITALEARSRDFMAEKEANRRLADKIKHMQSQLLSGGGPLQDTAAFQCALIPSCITQVYFDLVNWLIARPGIHAHNQACAYASRLNQAD